MVYERLKTGIGLVFTSVKMDIVLVYETVKTYIGLDYKRVKKKGHRFVLRESKRT